jgi:hypothetical protein
VIDHARSFRRAAPVNYLLLLIIPYVALVSVPMPWNSYGTGLDASWMLGLNIAHSQAMVAGRDIAFTYGPLGYLMYPDPICGRPLLALLYRVGLYLLWIGVLCRLVWIHPSRSTALWLALLLGLEFALNALPAQSQGTITLTAIALLTLIDRSRWRWLELCLLAVMAAFESLVKLDQGIEWIGIFFAVAAAAIIESRPLAWRERRRWLAVLILPFLFIAILFWLSTGSPGSLFGYIRFGLEIVTGHSETMGLAGPLWQVALAAATIATTYGAVALTASDLPALLPGLIPSLIVTFFAFKQAMVRQDVHGALFHLKFASGLLFLLVLTRAARDRRLILVLTFFSVVMAYAISVEQFPGLAVSIRDRFDLRMAGQTWSAFWHWRSSWANIGATEQTLRQPLRLPNRFREIVGNGTVDVEPWDVDIVQANGWRWLPRPAFQSYIAYTPALDRLNAEHLEGNHTADFVLLNFSAIDGRHPFLETPVSWRALLDRYDLMLSGAGWLLVEHRDQWRFKPLLRLANSTAHWDEMINVPRGAGLLVMAPQIRPSLAGRMESALFRSAAVYLDGVLSSGRTVHWRCIPRNLAGGFLIRPFPQNLQELAQLFKPEMFPPSADQITSVRFHADKPHEFVPEIPIVWSILPIATPQETPRETVSVYPFPKAWLSTLWLPGGRPPKPTNAAIRQHARWLEVTPTTDDPQLLFDVGSSLGRFQTLIVRARFQKADRIDAFFGKQVDGRGVNGTVPAANQWLDVYLNMSQNAYWEDEHGTTLRFDPVSSFGPGTTALIAGVWGSTQAAPPGWPDVQFYPVAASEAPKPRQPPGNPAVKN